MGCGCDNPAAFQYCYDADSDGNGAGESVEFCLADVEEGYVLDCTDLEPECATDDTDVCGVCAGPGLITFYYDYDDDGLGDPNDSLLACQAPGFAWVENYDDLDDDCNSNQYTDWFADVDGDGYCDYNQPTDEQLCDDYSGDGLEDGCMQDLEPLCATNDTDECGVCAGGNADQDCNGDCFGTAFVDSCGECAEGESGHIADSSQDCNGICFGDAFINDCGCVTEEDAAWCEDCAGTPNGDAELDECGVCDGLGIPDGNCDCDGNVLDLSLIHI